jgi:hypothetical protein
MAVSESMGVFFTLLAFIVGECDWWLAIVMHPYLTRPEMLQEPTPQLELDPEAEEDVYEDTSRW